MSISNIINPLTKKIYFELIPAGPPAVVPNLMDVLIAGNSAGTPTNPQTIENLDSLETQKIYQGNYLNLQIGEAGDTLQVKGATALGSMLVGNSVNTEELIAGVNGLVLTTNSSAPLGVEWAIGGGGSGVASVSAGLNVDITGTGANPIVGLKAPLTTTLNMGAVAITDSASATGTSGQYLTAGAGASTLWATLPTSVASVSAGLNIGITGTSTAPVVGLLAPLTSTLDVGSQSITSTTGAITITPLATNDLNQVISGTGKVHTIQSTIGGPTQPAYQVENTNANANAVHIDLYKNSATPAINDGIASLSYHANNASSTKIEYARIQADQRDTTAGSENGSVSVLACCSSATPVEVFRFNGNGLSGAGSNDLYKSLDLRNNTITTSTGNIVIQNNLVNNGLVSVLNDGAQGTLTVAKNGTSSGSLNIYSGTTTSMSSLGATTLSGNGGGGSGITIAQVSGATTNLITSQANVKFYPDFVLTNQNVNAVAVPPPLVSNSRLTLNNLGVNNANQWSDYGNNAFAGYSAFASDNNGNIWLAQQGSGTIYVYDVLMTTQLYTILLENGGNPKSIDVLKYVSGFMYIGGSFNSINGNATQQLNITRVSTASYVEDPIYDSGSSIYGTNQNSYVYTIEYDASNDRIFFGGNFSQFSNGANCRNIAQITSATNTGGGQVYTELDGGVDNEVFALYYDITATNYLYVGGSFTTVGVNTTPQNMNYGAMYYPLAGTWQYPFCQNQLDNRVYVILLSATTQYLFVAGNFSNPSPLTGSPYSVYVDVVDAQNLYYDTLLTLATPPNQKQAYGVIFSVPPAVMNANDLNIEAGFQVWSSLGTPTGAGAVSGINNFAGNWKVIYDSYTFVRSHLSLPHSCEFVGSFIYDALPYSKYIITTRNVSQQFIGDSANTYWSIIGGGVGAFSN